MGSTGMGKGDCSSGKGISRVWGAVPTYSITRGPKIMFNLTEDRAITGTQGMFKLLSHMICLYQGNGGAIRLEGLT